MSSAIPSDSGILRFRRNGVWLAVPVGHVREVVGASELIPLPAASPRIPAVIEWRGRAIAIVDVGNLVDAAPLDLGDPPPRVVVMEAAGETFGVPVDAVMEATYFADARSADEGSIAEDSDSVLTEVRVDGELVGFLDLDRYVTLLLRELSR